MFADKLHIILAEDDSDDRLFFKEAFDEVKIEHTLTTFENGNDLMNYLQHVEELPHIIFLDLHMPGKSGLDCLKEIKSHISLRDITIAIYSTSGLSDDQEKTFIAGANIYIKKPNDLSVLKKILTEVVYINWQYVTDGLNRENFMLNY